MLKDSSSNTADGYIALFVRMLGLDHDPLDREQAVIALWKYSLGGKQCLDMIMQFRGSVNLTVNLLKSESDAACEAAAGLLRMISSVNMYRDLVAVSGAIEEINGILRRSSFSPNVQNLPHSFYCPHVLLTQALKQKLEFMFAGEGAKLKYVMELICG